jgi:hypothetical protein
MPSTPSGSRPPPTRFPSSSSRCTIVVGLGPVHSDKDHLAPLVDDTLFEPEDPSSYLMDQCSRHDIPPAVEGDLTDRQGHDLLAGE